MAATDVATLSIKVDSAGAVAGLSAVEGAINSAKRAALELTGALGVGLGLREIVSIIGDAQKSFAQLEAGVRSTGGAAGYTADQLQTMARSMQDLTGFSHAAIEQTQAIFLLFQNLKGVQFEQATQAAADLAARMGTDVPSAARQLGKALEDPTTGLMMLRRAGVVFTQQQQEQIKAMVEAGQLMKAQTEILDLVTQKVGGSAAAYRDTFGGALSNLRNQIVDFLEVSQKSSVGIIAAINAMADAVKPAGEKLKAFIGGLVLLWADFAAGIQLDDAEIYEATSKMLVGLGEAIALVPGLATVGATVAAKGVELGKSADELTKSTNAWKDSIYATIAGLGQATPAVAAHGTAVAGTVDAYAKLRAEATKHLADLEREIGFDKTHLDLLGQIAVAEKKVADIKEQAAIASGAKSLPGLDEFFKKNEENLIKLSNDENAADTKMWHDKLVSADKGTKEWNDLGHGGAR